MADLLDQYNNLQNGTTDPGSVAMTAGGAGLGLSNFFNTPSYALAYGNNQNADPLTRFFADPGVQMANKLSLNALTNQYAGKGLSQSGALGVGLQNAALSNYQNFIGGQQGLFNNYQNMLAGIANQGAQYNGAQQAYQMGQNNASLLGQANLNTGMQLGNWDMSTGQNIASLLANLGSLQASAYLNTGAAQSNNIMNMMGMQAQMNAANAAAASRQQGGMGGYGGMGSGGFF